MADPGEDGEVPVARAVRAKRAEPVDVPAHVEVSTAVGHSYQEGWEHQPPFQGHQGRQGL